MLVQDVQEDERGIQDGNRLIDVRIEDLRIEWEEQEIDQPANDRRDTVDRRFRCQSSDTRSCHQDPKRERKY